MNNSVKFINKKQPVLLVLLFCVQLLSAEDIRGHLIQDVVIKAEAGYFKQISLGIGDIIAVSLEKDSEFLSGLQLEITQTDQLKQYAEYFAIEIFNKITPLPDINTISYTGNNIFFQVMPYLNTINIRLPINTPDTRHETPGNYILSKTLKYDQFPLLVTIQVVSKGLSDSELLKDYYIKIKPELVKKGYLNLKVTKPETVENEKVNTYIDGARIADWKTALLLDTGLHALKITADNCIDENSSFLIEIGKTTNLEINLKELVAKIFIDILPGTQLFIDGNKIDSIPKTGITIAPGNHTLRFKIGEYSLSKSIYIAEGKKYNITLFFSIDIKES